MNEDVSGRPSDPGECPGRWRTSSCRDPRSNRWPSSTPNALHFNNHKYYTKTLACLGLEIRLQIKKLQTGDHHPPPIMPCQGGKEIKQPHLTWFYTIISSRPVVWLGTDLWILWISKTHFTRKRPHHQWAKDSRGCCFHFPKPPPLKCVLPPAYERK